MLFRNTKINKNMQNGLALQRILLHYDLLHLNNRTIYKQNRSYLLIQIMEANAGR